jgi:hypothetical protein
VISIVWSSIGLAKLYVGQPLDFTITGSPNSSFWKRRSPRIRSVNVVSPGGTRNRTTNSVRPGGGLVRQRREYL